MTPTDAVDRPLVHEARYRVRFDEAGPDGASARRA
jgi:hypothetical protein